VRKIRGRSAIQQDEYHRIENRKAGAALPPPVRKGWRGFAASCAERLARLYRLLCGKAGAALPPPVRKGWRGFAASRAESLWLSVMRATLLAATPPEAKPLLVISCQRKAGGFPHGKRQSRSPKITSNQRSLQIKDHFKDLNSSLCLS